MTYPAYIREKARQMRIERDMTLDEIAERLAIAKTTVWYWIKDIDDVPMGASRKSAARTTARERAAQANVARARKRRDEAYAEGLSEFEALDAEPTFRDFVCIYIGEGTKRSRGTVAVANSDWRVILVADHWLRRLSRRPVGHMVQHHQDQDTTAVRAFWSGVLSVEAADLCLIPKSNSGQLRGRTWRSEHGVMTVRTHDTYLRCKVQAWMDEVQKSWLRSA